MMAAASSSCQPHHLENLPLPHCLIQTAWNSTEVREACQKSRAALDVVNPLSHLIQVSNVQNLFLITYREYYKIDYWHPDEEQEEEREWGSRDMMLDLGCATPEERVDYLRAAARFSGGAVYLLLEPEDLLSEEEETAWVEALSDAADDDASPRSLLIRFFSMSFNPYNILSALKKSNGLTHLSLHVCRMSDECVEVLSHFTSLTSLHLHWQRDDYLASKFVSKLGDLHPSTSPLAASLQRLYIFTHFIDWSGSTGFLQHWTHLKQLTLHSHLIEMRNEQIIDWMHELAPSLKGKITKSQTAGSNSTDPRPRLYSLSVGRGGPSSLLYGLSVESTAVVMDALSASGLPFLELRGLQNMDSAIEAQLERNRRMFLLGDLERVPAKSMRLFICGDAYAGKTTLLSTMHSIYAGQRKRDMLKWLLTCGGTLIQRDRTKGIEVRAIHNDRIRLSLWDMAGQEEFHAFHDSMLPDIGSSSYQAPSLFMFVWSPRTSQNSRAGPEEKTEQDFEVSFRYWLKFLASKSRKSNTPLKVIVVFTRADQMKLIASAVSNTMGSLRSEFKEVIEIEDATFEVDARNMDSVKHLSEHIFGIAVQMLQGVLVYDICTEVGQHLSKHLETSNQRIITWSNFSEICKDILRPILNEEEAKILRGIALSLNESGIIIYVNNVSHIVLDPNWFCNKIMGSLIHFRDGKEKSNTMKINGFTNRHFLEETLELVTKDEVKGSLLVDLMEAMHLCCKVPDNHDKSTRNKDRLFIPATLTVDPIRKGLFGGMDQRPKWRTLDTSTLDVCNPYVYMGRRLECENANLTFLTPGLFPRIQVVFNNTFQEEGNADVNLGKDFISIYVQHMEIIVVFCKAKSDHVIDVLVRVTNPNTQQTYMEGNLDYVEENVINHLIKICAQPSGIQGVKLIESVIRPDSFHDPSKAEHREDQCVQIITLKEKLRRQLEQGQQECHVWKKSKYLGTCTTNSFIDILGPKNYSEVFMSCKAWLEEVKDILSEMDEVNGYKQHESHCSVSMINLKNSQDVEMQEDEYCKRTVMEEIARALEPRFNSVMEEIARALEPRFNSVKKMVAANHQQILSMRKKLDEIHTDLKEIREDVMSKVQKAVDKLLKFVMESEAEKQLPRFVILTSDGVNNIRKLVTTISGGHVSCIRVQLCCEDRICPHPVENQRGITITSLSEPLKEGLERALPYVNGLVWILTTAAKLGINSVIPLAGTVIQDHSVAQLKLPKNYPLPASSSRFSHVRPTVLQSSKEWQKCLALILKDKYGGITNEIIYDKFHLKRATYKDEGSNIQVAWLCDKHYREQTPFPLD